MRQDPLAKAHARSGDAIAIASYRGRTRSRLKEAVRIRGRDGSVGPLTPPQALSPDPRLAAELQAGVAAADAVAGLSVWALLVPQSLAYAALVGVPVQYGLYTAFAALLAYPLFGTSRQLVAGPSATVGAVSAAVVAPLAGAAAMGTSKAVGYTAALALVTAARLRRARPAAHGLGLDLPLQGGDGGLHPRASRSGSSSTSPHKLFGVDVDTGTYMQELWWTIEALPDTSATTLAVGAGSLVLLLVMRYLLPKWPRALIVMALAIVAVNVFDLAEPRRRRDGRRADRPVLDRPPGRRLERDRGARSPARCR